MQRRWAWLLPLLFMACATRVPPNGGAVDKDPPKLVRMSPEQGSTQFIGDRMELEFDEFVELKDAGTGILISPPMAVPPEYVLKGKNLQIRFKEKPEANTTYTITLAKSVTDLTESNPFVEQQLVFSTGPVLDSLRCTGQVLDALSNQAVKDVLVALYTAFDDSIPETTLPRYFARSDEAGNFKLQNLKAGQYRILVFQDANSDYKLNLPEEKLGFQNEPVQIDTGSNNLASFRIFSNPGKKQKLLRKTYEAPGKVTLRYALPPERWSIRGIGPSQAIQLRNAQPKIGQDSIQIWIPGAPTDSLRILSETETHGVVKLDTLNFFPKRSTKMGAKQRGPRVAADSTFKLNLIPGNRFRPNDTLMLGLSAPISTVVPERIHVYRGSQEIPLGSWKVSADSMQIGLWGIPQDTASYRLKIEFGAVRDLYNKPCDSLETRIQRYNAEDLGKLIFKVNPEPKAGNFVLELMDKGGKTLHRTQMSGSYTWVVPNLLPGNYTIRIIEDRDGNGVWTNGDWQKGRQPEPVVRFAKTIEMRADWDVEEEWTPFQAKRKMP